ncbi:response regulator transcription factor [Nocardiopsis rhodophaea]|uniref:Response regulator transcription factor n=1 Tax=Nocardiopsis rhodophaea TaxID=280238 RepID=A0ABN2TQ67_9ACTN
MLNRTLESAPPSSVEVDGVRILVALKNEVVRRGLETLLCSIEVAQDVESCARSAEALAVAMAKRSDVLIVGLDDHGEGLDLLLSDPRIGRCKVLLLMRGSGEAQLSSAARLRADGYLLEEELTVRTLEDTLHRLLKGEVPMPPAMVRVLLHRAGRPSASRGAAAPSTPARGARLTLRERQALALLVEGMSNKQIARRMCISDHAIKRVMGKMLIKLDCANRTQAVALALRYGLAESAHS